MFVKAVAQQRGVAQGAVREGYGQGRSLLAAEAVKAGLADRTGTLDDVLEKLGVKRAAGSGARASSANITGTMDTTGAIDMTKTVRIVDITAKKPVDDPATPEPDEDDYCECKCDECKAGNHAQCSDDMCADPNCGHPSRALATPALTAEEQKAIEAEAAGRYLTAIALRRRKLSLF